MSARPVSGHEDAAALAPRLHSERIYGERYVDTLHTWLRHPRAVYWEMLGASREDVLTLLAESAAGGGPEHGMRIGFLDGAPQFMYELYEPRESELAEAGTGYRYRPGDVGMHLLVAASDNPIRGFTLAVMRHIMREAFIELGAWRVVVEPDVRNADVHRLNAAVGFLVEGDHPVGNKIARLSYCDRSAFLRIAGITESSPGAPKRAEDYWDVYGRRLAAKILAEFSHERMIEPEPMGAGMFRVAADDLLTTYEFSAQQLALDSWWIDPTSVQRRHKGEQLPVDPIALIGDLECRCGLGGPEVSRETVTTYVEELINTLAVGAQRPPERRMIAAELVHADFQQIEAAMTEGHPCFVANAGRKGFGAADIHRYAPEHAPRINLIWLAVATQDCTFSAMGDLDYATLLREELGEQTLARFDQVLYDLNLSPQRFHYLPVHPWQWEHAVARLCAPDVADRRIVEVGVGEDLYQPQQSIRTLFNVSEPTKSYVKLSLSIVNMGFTRGMSADYMSTTPLINDWVRGQIGNDPYLASIGFEVLYEYAAIGYRNPLLNRMTQAGSEYRKLVSALWRESPVTRLRAGETLATMAALLHIDHQGSALIGALIDESGLPAAQWIRQYLDAYLHPIIYLLYRHELKFSPHGENIILILDDARPVRVILKDIGEEVSILGAATDLPQSCARARTEESDDRRNLGILSDIVDDFLRPLAAVLHGYRILDEEALWGAAAASIDAFHAAHPDLADRLAAWDLYAPTFGAIHLNRLQLANSRRMVTPGDAYGQIVDDTHQLANPLLAHRPAQKTAEATR